MLPRSRTIVLGKVGGENREMVSMPRSDLGHLNHGSVVRGVAARGRAIQRRGDQSESFCFQRPRAPGYAVGELARFGASERGSGSKLHSRRECKRHGVFSPDGPHYELAVSDTSRAPLMQASPRRSEAADAGSAFASNGHVVGAASGSHGQFRSYFNPSAG
jgi:hypothetical protein